MNEEDAEIEMRAERMMKRLGNCGIGFPAEELLNRRTMQGVQKKWDD